MKPGNHCNVEIRRMKTTNPLSVTGAAGFLVLLMEEIRFTLWDMAQVLQNTSMEGFSS